MSASNFLAGLALFALIVVPPCVGARLLLRRILPSASGSLGFLAAAVAMIGVVTVVSEILGSFGEFRRWPLIACCLMVGVGLSALGVRGSRPERSTRNPFASRNLVTVLAVLAAAAVIAAWTTRALDAWTGGIVDTDSLQYHLPFAATFAQTHSLFNLHYAWLDPVWTFYPFGTELFHAIAILAFGRDVLSPALNIGWLGLALLGAWCFGRARGTSPLCMLLALGVLGSPLLVPQAGTANPDIGGLALVLCSGALFVAPGPAPTTYTLAGAAAGLAVSTSLEFLPLVAGLTLGTLFADHRPVVFRRRTFVLGLLVTGSYWYVRNLVQIGNPFPTIKGAGPLRLPAPRFPAVERYGFSVAHYASSGQFWRQTVVPGMHSAFGLTWPLLLVLSAAGVCACFLPRVTRELRPIGLAGGIALIVYPFTPLTAYGPPGHPFLFWPVLRAFTPGLILGLVALPVATDSLLSGSRSRWNQLVAEKYPIWVVVGVATGLLVVAASLITGYGGNAVRLSHSTTALGFGLLALTCALACTLSRRGFRTLAVSTIIAITLASVFTVQRGYLSRRDSSSARSIDAWARTVSHQNIGTVAYPDQYPLFGRNLTNRVEYVGSRGPHGALLTASTCQQWHRQLAAGGYSYVIVGVNDWGLAPIPEQQWTASDPAAKEILTTPQGTVFSIDPSPRASAGC